MVGRTKAPATPLPAPTASSGRPPRLYPCSPAQQRSSPAHPETALRRNFLRYDSFERNGGQRCCVLPHLSACRLALWILLSRMR